MSRSKSLINNLLRHYASFVIIVLILMVSSTCDTVMVWPTISWKKSKNYVYVLTVSSEFRANAKSTFAVDTKFIPVFKVLRFI